MSDYIITTDNTCDFPAEYYVEQGLPRMSLSYIMDDQTYSDDNPMPDSEFYAKMRNGKMPTTSQVNPEMAREFFENILKNHKKILHIAFSGGLSGTYNSARIAAEEINEECPDAQVTVIDSLSASMGEGLLVYYALKFQREGMGYEELAKWLEDHKLNICHNFTVDDLFHLFRGGRVSRTAAVVGTMINLKPVLHVDNEGCLKPLSKVRGRKKSLLALVDDMEKQIGSWADKNEIVFISHGDCIEDANFVKEQVGKRFGINKFMVSMIGPTIGAHAGPGTVALFYLGDHRKPQ